jgi:Zn-dependent peptidase ImmA (M78 family)
VFPGNEKEYDKIELFCNEVAANALMPDVFMKSLNPTVFSSVERIFSVSKSLGVSSFALLVRGKNK